jgi:hypothetical protein
VSGVGSAERLHQLADVGASQTRGPSDLGQRVLGPVAERNLDRARGELTVAACAIDLVITEVCCPQVLE